MRNIKNYKNFLLEYIQVESLKYSIFDIDDNKIGRASCRERV